jgi:vacuolar-type H+-ATPase subunit E/Vma4
MGYQELIASLRAKGEEKIKEIRDNAQAEADSINAESADTIARMREEFREKQDTLGKNQEEHVLSSAGNKARIIRLYAEQSLSDRLFRLALACLEELRNDEYEKVFKSLCSEIPSVSWDETAVNPDDAGMAHNYFPDSKILSDPLINGGVEVFREIRSQHIINTFKKRLERAWEEILPLIVIDAYKEVSKYGISSTN